MKNKFLKVVVFHEKQINLDQLVLDRKETKSFVKILQRNIATKHCNETLILIFKPLLLNK